MIAPSAVSSAAPTLKFEYAACAWRRALRAATISLETLNDALQQRDERAADAPRGLHDLLVDQRLRQHARRHVRDARDPQYLHAHVPRRNGFGHRRHADRIGAERA